MSCISLWESQTCREFRNYSILPFIGVFKDVLSFDTYIEKNQAFSLGRVKCPSWPLAIDSRIRYSRSFVCAHTVYASTRGIHTTRVNGQCNKDISTPPPSLCKSSMLAVIKDFSDLVNRACPSAGISKEYQDFVETAVESNCYRGFGTEAIENGNFVASKVALTGTGTDTGTGTVSATGQSMSTSKGVAPPSVDTDIDSMNPFLIAAGIVAGIVVAWLIILFVKRRATNKKTLSLSRDVSLIEKDLKKTIRIEKPEKMQLTNCIFKFEPNLFDEIELQVGDQVNVVMRYSDGWAYGLNKTTKQKGAFPLVCVCIQDSDSESESENNENSLKDQDVSTEFDFDANKDVQNPKSPNKKEEEAIERNLERYNSSYLDDSRLSLNDLYSGYFSTRYSSKT